MGKIAKVLMDLDTGVDVSDIKKKRKKWTSESRTMVELTIRAF